MPVEREPECAVCIACGESVGDDVEFCGPCQREVDAIQAERCSYCRCSPCADPRGCAAEARADDRADRARDP